MTQIIVAFAILRKRLKTKIFHGNSRDLMTVISLERQSEIFENNSQVTGIPVERSEPKFSHTETYSMTITVACFFSAFFGNMSGCKICHESKSPTTLIN